MANAPIHKMKIGLISATIWENDKFYSVEFSRAYKNGDDDWKSTTGFTVGDLPVVGKLTDMATDWIMANPIKD